MHLWQYLPLGFTSRVKVLYECLTLTPTVKAFVTLALLHSIIQCTLQSIAFANDQITSSNLASIMYQAGVPQLLAVFSESTGQLQLCDAAQVQAVNCMTITSNDFDSMMSEYVQGMDWVVTKRSVSADPQLNATGSLESVTVSGLTGVPDGTVLSTQCVESFAWPVDMLKDARREDATTLAFEMWLLGISLLAILKASVPHLVASFASITISTAWSVYMIVRDFKFQSDFDQLVMNSSCGGVNVVSDFWTLRIGVDIAVVACNGIVLPVAGFLTLRLFKLYSSTTFKRVGACSLINRIHKTVLALSVVLQMSAFFTIGSAALWIDELRTGVIGQFTSNRLVYEIVFVVTNVLVVPWLLIGWKSVRMEHNFGSIFFLLLGVLITTAWAAMFSSSSYRWTFSTWPFFACMTILSFLLLVASLALGLVCRSNFGKGFAHYLKVQKALEDTGFPSVSFSSDPERDTKCNTSAATTRSSSPNPSNKENSTQAEEDDKNSRFTILLPKETMKASLADMVSFTTPLRLDDVVEERDLAEYTPITPGGASLESLGSSHARRQSRVHRFGNGSLRRISLSEPSGAPVSIKLSMAPLSRIITNTSNRSGQSKLETIPSSPSIYSPSLVESYMHPSPDNDAKMTLRRQTSSANRSSRRATDSFTKVMSPLSAFSSSAKHFSSPITPHMSIPPAVLTGRS